MRAFGDEPVRLFGHFEIEDTSFGDDHVVWMVAADGVVDVVEGVQDAAFANDEGRAVGPLTVDKFGGGNGGGKHVLLGCFDVELAELHNHVQRRVRGVVGQE